MLGSAWPYLKAPQRKLIVTQQLANTTILARFSMAMSLWSHNQEHMFFSHDAMHFRLKNLDLKT